MNSGSGMRFTWTEHLSAARTLGHAGQDNSGTALALYPDRTQVTIAGRDAPLTVRKLAEKREIPSQALVEYQLMLG